MDATLGGELSRAIAPKKSIRYKRRCCKKWRKGKMCTRCPQRAYRSPASIAMLLAKYRR